MRSLFQCASDRSRDASAFYKIQTTREADETRCRRLIRRRQPALEEARLNRRLDTLRLSLQN